jgi:hypothetical protein
MVLLPCSSIQLRCTIMMFRASVMVGLQGDTFQSASGAILHGVDLYHATSWASSLAG